MERDVGDKGAGKAWREAVRQEYEEVEQESSTAEHGRRRGKRAQRRTE